MSLLVSTTCIALVICSYYLCLFLVNCCLRIASSSQRESASLPSTEPSAPQWMYDVFLSFRGEETRKGIAFEIYDGLKNRGGIKTFMDDQELQAGAPISPSLLKAIEESRFAIIVLSPNYASSSWCLEELTKIVDCMKDENRILPLFYHVKPSDVRHQKRSFEEAFTEHEKKSRHEIEKLKKWRDALKTVSNFSGWDTQNFKTERELVGVIVESVCNKVGRQITEHLNLQTEVDKLSVGKATVAEKVTAAYAKGEKIHANVQDWLKKVEEITKEAQEFLRDEIQATEEPHDSMNHRSKKSLELLQVVTQLHETREFSDISYIIQAKDYCLESGQDYQEFDSRASTVEKIMDELRSPNCADIILVHGIGGVGKTTLAEQVLRQAEKQKLFDDLVMVRDVKKPNLEAIQQVIADKLGLSLSEIQTTAGRADKICDRIKGKKTSAESKQDKKTLI
ncbi:hypothetical protein M0R45_024476 [Rubus argutus]|uniref:TIR domain-containing protein n=1 Tax=Rubus argutus TaxID=59490 RepID=A0AAW1WVI8_RUBAR